MTHPDIPSSHGLIERGLGNGHAFWTIAMVGAVLVLQSSVTALVLSPEPLSLDAEPTRASQTIASATTSENAAQPLKTASTLATPADAQSASAESASTESLSTKAINAESISTKSEITRPESASVSGAPALKAADQAPAAVASTTLPADAAANAATAAVAAETSRHDESGNAVAQSSGHGSETGPDSAEKPVKVAASTPTMTEASVNASGSAKPVQPVAAAEALPTPRAKPAHLVRKAPAKAGKAAKAAKAALVKASRKAKPQAIAKSTGVRPTDRQLRRLPGDYLTLQLISLKDDAHLDAFVERFGQQTEQARIKVKKPDGIRHVLVHGTFASRGDADRVAGQIFKRFGIKPWVRRIEDLRQELSTGA